MSSSEQRQEGPAEDEVPVGHLRLEGDDLQWSLALFAMHGFAPGEVVPTLDLMVAHCHPEDRAHLSGLMRTRDGLRAGQYRLLDAHGTEHWVALTVEADRATQVLEARVLDLTARHTRAGAEAANAMLEAATESRAVIDQAKGALRLLYGIDETSAFALLRWSSQQHNVKVRTLAERVVEVCERGLPLPEPVRRQIDARLSALGAGQPADEASDREPGTRPARVPELTITPDLDAVVLSVRGALDLPSAPGFAQALRSAARQAAAARPLLIDLTGCRTVGPAAIDQIAATRRRLLPHGTSVHVLVGDDEGTKQSLAGLVDTVSVPSHVPVQPFDPARTEARPQRTIPTGDVPHPHGHVPPA